MTRRAERWPRCTCEPERRDCPRVWDVYCPIHGHPDEGGGWASYPRDSRDSRAEAGGFSGGLR